MIGAMNNDNVNENDNYFQRLSTFSIIGAMNYNDNDNANENLFIIALRAFQISNFKFQDFLYDRRHEYQR